MRADIIAVFGILLLVGLLLVGTISSPKKSNFENQKPTVKEGYRCPANFLVFNYFPNHFVKVESLDPATGVKELLVDIVRPLKTQGIIKEKVERLIKPGNVLRIYIIDSDGKTNHYSDLVVDNEPDKRIKNLHVGMVTSRFINSTDSLRMSTTAANAIQGNAWLKIHNLTELPLRLNDDVIVAPHSTERYLGYLHQGVTLGTIFKDQDGLYPDFQYLHPDSDLYYGVVSDLRQPIYGPWQLEFSDDCDMDQTLWPFELGQM